MDDLSRHRLDPELWDLLERVADDPPRIGAVACVAEYAELMSRGLLLAKRDGEWTRTATESRGYIVVATPAGLTLLAERQRWMAPSSDVLFGLVGKLSWNALSGTLRPDIAIGQDIEYAIEAGLVQRVWERDHVNMTAKTPPSRRRTPLGESVVAHLREVAKVMTDEDVRLIRHAMSSDGRNHFCADEGTSDAGAWSRMTMVGWAMREKQSSLGRSLYRVTPLGRAVREVYLMERKGVCDDE